MSVLKKCVINRKTYKYLCIAYVVVLLCFLAGYYMIPGEEFLDVPDNGYEMQRKAQTERQELNKNILAVGEGEYKGLHIIKKWDFKYDGRKLDISYSDSNLANYRVYVEHKDTADGLIEIQQLATSSVISHIDITEKVSRPVTVGLTGSTLTLSIEPPDAHKFETRRFDKEFPMLQFVKSPAIDEDHFYSITGVSVIYIRAPKQVEINGKGIIRIEDLANGTYKQVN